ncbi:MAG: response regulator [Moraxellaceae bacterium]|nr:response regulator [Moraxellaceae bacterium]
MARVLIVDDSPTDKLAIYSMLKKYGHNFLFAEDGLTAIATAKEKQPDIILMDVVMPDVNGYQATRKLAQDKDTAHIPVVMISSKTQESDRYWGMRQGAKAYVCKPAQEAELAAVINQFALTH